MLNLLSPLQLEEKDGVATVVLWLCEAGDEHYSFRAALTQLEDGLASFAAAHHDLPPEHPMEDFVQGQFCWGGRDFSLYYERSLGYLQFSSPVLAEVQALQDALASNTQVAATRRS